MAEKLFMKGNEALAEGAIRAGCRFFAGYPITPQNEVPEYMSWRLPEVGGTFIQAESEVSAINMLFGASSVGTRTMTSSSSPGISLKQEGISYCASAELPIFFANVVRGGPGLGNIAPSQGDYFQSTRGGGHGDYRVLVLAPTRELVMQIASDAEGLTKYCNLNVMAVVGGMDRGLSYAKVRRAMAHIRNGARFYGTNPDPTFPTPEGLVPGAGAVIAALRAAGGVDPIIIGKPAAFMFHLCAERAQLPMQELLVVGDRLETDIAGGQSVGARTALVLSGVSTREQAAQWQPQPDVIAQDLATLVGA